MRLRKIDVEKALKRISIHEPLMERHEGFFLSLMNYYKNFPCQGEDILFSVTPKKVEVFGEDKEKIITLGDFTLLKNYHRFLHLLSLYNSSPSFKEKKMEVYLLVREDVGEKEIISYFISDFLMNPVCVLPVSLRCELVKILKEEAEGANSRFSKKEALARLGIKSRTTFYNNTDSFPRRCSFCGAPLVKRKKGNGFVYGCSPCNYFTKIFKKMDEAKWLAKVLKKKCPVCEKEVTSFEGSRGRFWVCACGRKEATKNHRETRKHYWNQTLF
jgi:ssDNA-binding Zn-finger/Zn-ribbon topoisomerase 1